MRAPPGSGSRWQPLFLLCCAALLLGGAGMLQWRAALLRDLELIRRSGKHFEQMYRDSEADSAEWKAKYQRVKGQLEQNTLKLRELETANLEASRAARQGRTEVAQFRERAEKEASAAAQLRSGAKEEVEAKLQAVARADACDARLGEALAASENCQSSKTQAEQQRSEAQSSLNECQAELKQVQELLGQVESQLATVSDAKVNLDKELDALRGGSTNHTSVKRHRGTVSRLRQKVVPLEDDNLAAGVIAAQHQARAESKSDA
mmetsp:Transcript_11911/g.21483  ORF Transcript_11911/g.21483 Transcript_11911/m.21483 type:complete len:263 (-) Transcript_11911:78-866(-)